LASPSRREIQAGRRLLARALVRVNQVGTSIGVRRSFSKSLSQRTIRPTDFRAFLQNDRISVIDRRRNRLICVRNLPQDLTVCNLLDILVGKARNLLLAIQNNPQTIAAGAFLQKIVDASNTP